VSDKANIDIWPALPWEDWKDTCETLHRWTQIVGKVKLKLATFLNEWWEVGFDVSARGLSSGITPCGDRVFEMHFDFIDHKLRLFSSDGREATLTLYPRSVADFYREFVSVLGSMDIDVKINTIPVETTPDVPFEQDSDHASYEPIHVRNWWTILTHTTRVLQRYRSPFRGKSSPILFYWGSFDLSCARYSGRRAPMPAAGPRFYRITEDEENVCCGFWPGNPNAMGKSYGAPAFYSYHYPALKGIEEAAVRPAQARFNNEFAEFLLDYEVVRRSESPEQTLLDFFQSTYEAGARLAKWDRPALEQSLESLIERTVNAEASGQPGKAGSAAASVKRNDAA
jgi:hypothetical protein